MQCVLTDNEYPRHKGYYQIQAVEDFPMHGISKGDLGGFVEVRDRGADRLNHVLRENAWLDVDSTMDYNSYLGHGSLLVQSSIWETSVGDRSKVTESTLQDTIVDHMSEVSNSYVKNSIIVQRTKVSGINLNNSRASSSLLVNSNSHCIDLNNIDVVFAHITNVQQVFSVSAIGTELRRATVYPKLDGDTFVPYVTIGCWDGLLKDLPEEVSRRLHYYKYSHPEKYQRWVTQYRGFQQFAETHAEAFITNN